MVARTSEQRLTISLDVVKGETPKASQMEGMEKEAETKRGPTSKTGSTVTETDDIVNRNMQAISKEK